MQTLELLNKRYALPDTLEFCEGPGGLLQAVIHNPLATARIVLQGAQLIAWHPVHTGPVIWLSEKARFEPGKAIRGGIPICWPWFGNHPENASLPAHGFARTALWKVTQTQAFPNGSTAIEFCLCPSEATQTLWNHPFDLRYRITVGQTLTLELLTENPSHQPIRITEALHTYFTVGDVEQVSIGGLAGCRYVDKVNGELISQHHGVVRIAGETDRVFLDTPGEFDITDPVLGRRIHVHAEDSNSTIVWNPWREKAAKMGDMGEEGFRTMVCMEGGNAYVNAVTVAPGTTHRLSTTYTVHPGL